MSMSDYTPSYLLQADGDSRFIRLDVVNRVQDMASFAAEQVAARESCHVRVMIRYFVDSTFPWQVFAACSLDWKRGDDWLLFTHSAAYVSRTDAAYNDFPSVDEMVATAEHGLKDRKDGKA